MKQVCLPTYLVLGAWDGWHVRDRGECKPLSASTGFAGWTRPSDCIEKGDEPRKTVDPHTVPTRYTVHDGLRHALAEQGASYPGEGVSSSLHLASDRRQNLTAWPACRVCRALVCLASVRRDRCGSHSRSRSHRRTVSAAGLSSGGHGKERRRVHPRLAGVSAPWCRSLGTAL